MNTSLILAALGGLLALLIALKIGRWAFKVLFALVALAVIAGAAWWFLLGR